jgi:hypothetical protein
MSPAALIPVAVVVVAPGKSIALKAPPLVTKPSVPVDPVMVAPALSCRPLTPIPRAQLTGAPNHLGSRLSRAV